MFLDVKVAEDVLLNCVGSSGKLKGVDDQTSVAAPDRGGNQCHPSKPANHTASAAKYINPGQLNRSTTSCAASPSRSFRKCRRSM
jgi:hypothetical protein